MNEWEELAKIEKQRYELWGQQRKESDRLFFIALILINTPFIIGMVGSAV